MDYIKVDGCNENQEERKGFTESFTGFPILQLPDWTCLNALPETGVHGPTMANLSDPPWDHGTMASPDPAEVFDEIHERSADADFLSLVTRLLLHRFPAAPWSKIQARPC